MVWQLHMVTANNQGSILHHFFPMDPARPSWEFLQWALRVMSDQVVPSLDPEHEPAKFMATIMLEDYPPPSSRTSSKGRSKNGSRRRTTKKSGSPVPTSGNS